MNQNKWFFPSRGGAETEGFSNAGLAEFKGNPLQALAREVCQNSLDAADGSGRPVRVEFQKTYMEIDKFPGMQQLKMVIGACNDFWGKEGDANTKNFLKEARSSFKNNKFFVLRVSDYNTTGVQGAFSNKTITPWGSLVKGNAFSVKADEKNAAGSYGIGKAAPFVTSKYQTVFYRTYDVDGKRAVLGVARLMAHHNVTEILAEGEDPIRRSVGYFGEDANREPSHEMIQLDVINKRDEHGTDLFIPGFNYSSEDDTWVKAILTEVIDNFLYSVYSGKLEVTVDKRSLTRESLPTILSFLGQKAKHANMFYNVINDKTDDVIELIEPFHGMGTLRLRLIYDVNLNKKVLVVRNSGMKIANIPSLPRGVSYTGFLELIGDSLNEFFRSMENPKHNAWEPSRHSNPKLAKKYKDEVEDWVRNTINEKLVEVSGEESIVDIGDCFNFKERDPDTNKDDRKKEGVVDSVKAIEIVADEPTPKNKFKVKDIGGNSGSGGSAKVPGIIDDQGPQTGHRKRTGKRKGGNPTGRSGSENAGGNDSIYSGKREVPVSARIISKGDGRNKLIFIADDDIKTGEMEIVTKGENGKSLQIYVVEATGTNVKAVDGHIVITEIPKGIKQTVEFKIAGKRNYAMGVRAYGN